MTNRLILKLIGVGVSGTVVIPDTFQLPAVAIKSSVTCTDDYIHKSEKKKALEARSVVF
jgi:hypothetical protein